MLMHGLTPCNSPTKVILLFEMALIHYINQNVKSI